MKDLVLTALKEDKAFEDITTNSLGIGIRLGTAKLLAKEDLVFSGQQLFQITVLTMDPEMKINWYFNDGDLVLKGQNIALLSGNLIPLLKAERVALNFIGKLSGIATLTRCYVAQLEGTKTQILDTRKTTPGFRTLEKKAVRDGGGTNHRQNLADQVMIKDNHIRAAGSIHEAVTRIRQKTDLPMTVETRNLKEVEEASKLPVNRIMLDNMSNDDMKKAMSIIPSEIQTEASGNMNLERIRSVAELGVDFISVGALTHSAPTADISLMFDW